MASHNRLGRGRSVPGSTILVALKASRTWYLCHPRCASRSTVARQTALGRNLLPIIIFQLSLTVSGTILPQGLRGLVGLPVMAGIWVGSSKPEGRSRALGLYCKCIGEWTPLERETCMNMRAFCAFPAGHAVEIAGYDRARPDSTLSPVVSRSVRGALRSKSAVLVAIQNCQDDRTNCIQNILTAIVLGVSIPQWSWESFGEGEVEGADGEAHDWCGLPMFCSLYPLHRTPYSYTASAIISIQLELRSISHSRLHVIETGMLVSTWYSPTQCLSQD